MTVRRVVLVFDDGASILDVGEKYLIEQAIAAYSVDGDRAGGRAMMTFFGAPVTDVFEVVPSLDEDEAKFFRRDAGPATS